MEWPPVLYAATGEIASSGTSQASKGQRLRAGSTYKNSSSTCSEQKAEPRQNQQPRILLLEQGAVYSQQSNPLCKVYCKVINKT